VFNNPAGLAYESKTKTVYVCDKGNNAIRSIDPKGNVYTLAGRGVKGMNDGSADTATFDGPSACAIHWQDEVLLVADTSNHSIRAIIIADGRVRTIAGTGAPGHSNGRAREAVFNSPQGIAVARSCEFVYVADTGTYGFITSSIFIYSFHD
jgi:serine/threonine-protein kinase